MNHAAVFLKALWQLLPLAVGGLCFPAAVKKDTHTGPREGHRSGGSALDTLDRRYAAGAIGPIEYEEKVLAMGLKRRW